MCKLLKKWFRQVPVPAAVPEVESPVLMTFKKEHYKAFKQKINDQLRDEYNQDRKIVEDYNNTCPKCKEKQVVDRISRIQGTIDGSFGGSMGGSLFGFGGAIGGHIHGDIDTNEISVCTKCGNQWKKMSASRHSSYDHVQLEVWKLEWAIRGIEELPKVKYDPTDLKSPYNSLEEAIAAKTKQVEDQKKDVVEYWDGVCIEVIQEIAKENDPYHRYDKDKIEKIDGWKLKKYFGFKYAQEFLPKPE